MPSSVLIVGAGHNGLVAACYLAKAGFSVTMLEKEAEIGGATQSKKVFPDFEAKLSRYSYLVSLFPQKIIEDLSLSLALLSRNTASYTPYADKGLLISNVDLHKTRESILGLGYGQTEIDGYESYLEECRTFAQFTWDSLLCPLKSKQEWKNKAEAEGIEQLWTKVVEQPIGTFINSKVQSDVLRGVLFTDAKIGSYTHALDTSLLQNKTFFYHIVGNATGEWRVPKGGMGQVVSQLEKKARELGVNILTEQEVLGHTNHLGMVSLKTQQGLSLEADYLLWNTPPVENRAIAFKPDTEGTAFKINMLLHKLPRLKDQSTTAEEAFAGTFHIDQLFTDMERTFAEAEAGQVPSKLAGEIYCHTLTDPSILAPELAAAGYHTLTFFGLDLPYFLFEKDNEATKNHIVELFYKGINTYLIDDIRDCLAVQKDGTLCIEAKSSYDLEQDLSLPRGNIFHNGLSWFFAENESEIGTWGVETTENNVLICGSSALRGGAVSGIPGHNAAMKIIELNTIKNG